MTALLDSGFLYATVDQEVTYLLQARLGHQAMRQFIQKLAQSPIPLVAIGQEEIPRIHELLEQYADLELDFVDTSIITLAERLNIRHIFTLDQRDFRVVRPSHCDYFEIIP